MDFLASLTLVQTNLYRFGGPILMVIGTMSCILSLLVFTKKNLRKNPCSVYLVAYNISNFLLICTSTLTTTLANGYSIDPSLDNLIYCRFRFYTMLLFDVLSPSYLILASIDRILVTSRNALTRQKSSCRLAYICIMIVTLFWVFTHIHALILTNIIQFAPGLKICYFQLGIYFTVMGYYSLLFKGILVPFLMLFLGLWTVKNLQGIRRVIPASMSGTAGNAAVRSTYSKDRPFIKILLVDICVYIVFSLMISIALVYQQFIPSDDYIKTQILNCFMYIAIFSTYVPFCIGCYTNLVVSKTFRHGVKNIILCK